MAWGGLMEDKLQHFATRGINIRGVIYVGSNDGEEFVQCKAHGITNLIAFEPLSAPFDRLVQAHPDVLAFQVGLGNETAKVAMDVTQNDKASSALKRVDVEDWTQHEVFKDWNMGQWPIVGSEAVEIVRYEDFIKNQRFNPEDYNLLCMDVQGMELDALMGFGDYLDFFDALSVELSEKPVYVGEASAREVIEYLAAHGFRQDTPVSKHDDVLFVKGQA